jgi:ferritin-like metal-binding protein YciE
MPVTNLQELLKHELGDLLFAEKAILKGLKKMSREVSNPEMRQRMEAHYGETEQQIQNLERAFESLGLKAKAQKCPGILGIIQEHDEFKSDEEPSKPVLEAFNLGSGLRVEHYEIAAYRSAIALARGLRQREVVDLLKQNLEQEVAMAKFIENSAAESLQQVQGTLAAQENGGASGGRGGRGASKAAAKKAAGGASGARGGNGAGARKSAGGGRKTASTRGAAGGEGMDAEQDRAD